MSSENSRTILIVDDSKVNRLILREMLADSYQILEACDGNEAINLIRDHVDELSLILLDIVMPGMDGFQVLGMMNRYHWTDAIPVIVISADDSNASINKCYTLGATDYIRRPFDYTIVSHRVANTITLFERQNRLIHLVEDQIYEKEQNSSVMISVLAQVVEFRNGESGMHIHHIQTMTTILLQHLVQMTDRYPLTASDILRISTASALHDIGKITIDDKILNKPGRLTAEEFAIMKTHSMAGAQILQSVPTEGHTELLNVAYQICRWHHERYDGHGYPDGLVGDAIPIAAQVVSLADVYDALTSERCYKKAIPHDIAIRMIQNGECGAFSPLLLRCLDEVQDQLHEQLGKPVDGTLNRNLLTSVTRSILNGQGSLHHSTMIGSASDWKALDFFTDNSRDLFLIYDSQSRMLSLSPAASEFFGVNQSIADPSIEQLPFLRADELALITQAVDRSTPDHTDFELTLHLQSTHVPVSVVCHATGRTLWTDDGSASVQTGFLMRGHLHLPQASESTFHAIGSYRLSEADQMLTQLKKFFDEARLVDTKGHELVIEECELRTLPDVHCYDAWRKDKDCDNCIAATALRTGKPAEKLEARDGQLYQMLAYALDIDGTPCALEVIHRVSVEAFLSLDNSASPEQMREYHKILFRDPVTETWNRRYYEKYARNQHDICAVALLDCNRFKHLNDSYGHHCGDIALLRISQAIQTGIRPQDYLIRYGGDEFLLLLPDIDPQELQERLQHIADAVSLIRLEDYPQEQLSISIGAIYQTEGSIPEKVAAADMLMYQGKENGRNVTVKIEK